MTQRRTQEIGHSGVAPTEMMYRLRRVCSRTGPLLVRALQEDPELEQITGYAEDSGEGRWTVEEAINHSVPAPVISAALFARFASRQDDSPAMKAVAALRNQFGGHAVHSGPAG